MTRSHRSAPWGHVGAETSGLAGAASLRVGIVGSGTMALGAAVALAAEHDVEVVAVASRTEENAARLAAQLDPAPRVDTVSALIAAPDVDAVVIATPDDAHADLVIAAAEAGKDIVVEKPFTTDVAEADAAVTAVRKAGVIAMCLFNHRWVPAYAEAKELAAGLGEGVVGYARKNDRIEVPTSLVNWADRTTSAWFLSSHDIDLMTWLLDDHVVRVFATARSGRLQSMGINTPDGIQIQAEYSRGAVATFESAWVYPATFPTLVDSLVTLTCERGVIQVDRQRENITVATDEAFTFPRTMLQRVVHGVPAGAYRDALRHFVDCSLTGTEPLVTIESSRDVTAVLAAAHRSLETRVPEAVSMLVEVS